MNLGLLFRRKDGKLAVEYIAIIVLTLAVLLILVIFSDQMREKVVGGLKQFFENTLRRR